MMCMLEVVLSCLMEVGVMLVVGLLGIDFIFCYLEFLFVKICVFNEEGISVWMLIGVYYVFFCIIMGFVEKDVVIIDCVIGVKCVIFDYCFVVLDVYYLVNMVVEFCVGGLFGGKSGVIVFYMGDSKKVLQFIYDLLENCDVLISKLLLIYVNCNVLLFEQVLEFVCKGGIIDIISSIDELVVFVEGIVCVVQVGILLVCVIFSFDGNGSQLFFDDEGNLIYIGVVGFEMLLEIVQVLVKDYDFSISDVLCLFISSVVGFFNLIGKGEILSGNDVDLLVMMLELCIEQVYVCGKLMVKDGKVCVKGMFEMV